jgi:hypothetical protein
MSTEHVKHPALTPKSKMHEAVYLAWWKQKLNKNTSNKSQEEINWNEEIMQNRDWHTTTIPDTVIIEELRSRRQGTTYGASVEHLSHLVNEIDHATDEDTRDYLVMQFSLRAFEIAVEEFDTIDNVVAEVVFDQRPKWWEAVLAGFVEDEHKYRYGAH